MLNRERKEIIDALLESLFDNKNTQIVSIFCDFQAKVGCNFETIGEIIDWLNSEYIEKVKLTYLEYDILQGAYKNGYRYIARDENDYIYAYKEKPKKLYGGIWKGKNSDDQKIIISETTFIDVYLFDFIKWEDIEPRNIQKLLENCEVIK